MSNGSHTSSPTSSVSSLKKRRIPVNNVTTDIMTSTTNEQRASLMNAAELSLVRSILLKPRETRTDKDLSLLNFSLVECVPILSMVKRGVGLRKFREVLLCLQWKDVPAGRLVTSVQSKAEHVYILLSGVVSVHVPLCLNPGMVAQQLHEQSTQYQQQQQQQQQQQINSQKLRRLREVRLGECIGETSAFFGSDDLFSMKCETSSEFCVINALDFAYLLGDIQAELFYASERELLASTQLLSDWNTADEHIYEVAKLIQRDSYYASQRVFRKNKVVRDVFFLESGSIEKDYLNINNNYNYTIDSVASGVATEEAPVALDQNGITSGLLLESNLNSQNTRRISVNRYDLREHRRAEFFAANDAILSLFESRSEKLKEFLLEFDRQSAAGKPDVQSSTSERSRGILDLLVAAFTASSETDGSIVYSIDAVVLATLLVYFHERIANPLKVWSDHALRVKVKTISGTAGEPVTMLRGKSKNHIGGLVGAANASTAGAAGQTVSTGSSNLNKVEEDVDAEDVFEEAIVVRPSKLLANFKNKLLADAKSRIEREQATRSLVHFHQAFQARNGIEQVGGFVAGTGMTGGGATNNIAGSQIHNNINSLRRVGVARGSEVLDNSRVELNKKANPRSNSNNINHNSQQISGSSSGITGKTIAMNVGQVLGKEEVQGDVQQDQQQQQQQELEESIGRKTSTGSGGFVRGIRSFSVPKLTFEGGVTLMNSTNYQYKLNNSIDGEAQESQQGTSSRGMVGMTKKLKQIRDTRIGVVVVGSEKNKGANNHIRSVSKAAGRRSSSSNSSNLGVVPVKSGGESEGTQKMGWTKVASLLNERTDAANAQAQANARIVYQTLWDRSYVGLLHANKSSNNNHAASGISSSRRKDALGGGGSSSSSVERFLDNNYDFQSQQKALAEIKSQLVAKVFKGFEENEGQVLGKTQQPAEAKTLLKDGGITSHKLVLISSANRQSSIDAAKRKEEYFTKLKWKQSQQQSQKQQQQQNMQFIQQFSSMQNSRQRVSNGSEAYEPNDIMDQMNDDRYYGEGVGGGGEMEGDDNDEMMVQLESRNGHRSTSTTTGVIEQYASEASKIRILDLSKYSNIPAAAAPTDFHRSVRSKKIIHRREISNSTKQ